jgi:hypothetical protein
MMVVPVMKELTPQLRRKGYVGLCLYSSEWLRVRVGGLMDNSPLLDRSINLTVVVERPSTSIKIGWMVGKTPSLLNEHLHSLCLGYSISISYFISLTSAQPNISPKLILYPQLFASISPCNFKLA